LRQIRFRYPDAGEKPIGIAPGTDRLQHLSIWIHAPHPYHAETALFNRNPANFSQETVGVFNLMSFRTNPIDYGKEPLGHCQFSFNDLEIRSIHHYALSVTGWPAFFAAETTFLNHMAPLSAAIVQYVRS
jgi:hypothetical protein